MPKDEFDFDDPMELNGVGLACAEDTTEAMTECFVEEFMRLGLNPKQILAMFRNPHYLGMNMALEKRGEQFVRDTISEVFARWGRVVSWPGAPGIPLTPALSPSEGEGENRPPSQCKPVTDDCTVTAGITGGEQRLFPRPRRGGEGQGEGVTNAQPLPASPPEQTIALEATLADPMGVPIPKLTFNPNQP